MRTKTTTVLLVMILSSAAYADSYVIPPDYHVTCLDLATGKVVWKTQPKELARPTITAGDEVVAAKSKIRIGPNKTKTLRYYLQPMTGQLMKTAPKEDEGVAGPLASLPQSLKDSAGRVFEYDRGNTRHLVVTVDRNRKIVKKLSDFPYDLHIVGDLAIYTFAGGVSVRDTGGGDVFAYDLKGDKIAWKFAASTELPDLSRAAYTGISVDEDLVLISVDQTLFALALDSGKMLWKSRLPRQSIRRYDSPWTRIGRIDDKLVVACYEDLFMVQRKDGKLVWSFDCGPFGAPWPTIKNNRVFVATRK